MATVAFGIAGAAIGSMFGASSLGFSLGVTLGSYLYPPESPDAERGKLNDVKISGSNKSSPIPQVFGRSRIGGNVIWSSDYREHVTTEEQGGKGGGGQTTTVYTYDLDFAVSLCVGEVQAVTRIWANKEVIYDNRSGTPKYADFLDADNLTFYLGSNTQDVDPVVEAAIGAGNATAHRGLCYVVFSEFYLTKFNGSFPALEFEVWGGVPYRGTQLATGDQATAGARQKLSTICTALFSQSGYASPDLTDFTDLEDILVTGFILQARTELKSILETLSQAYLVDFVEVDGKVYGRKRTPASSATLTIGEIGAATDSDGPDVPVTITRTQDYEIPASVEISYIDGDPAGNGAFDTATRRYRLGINTDSDDEQSANLPVVFSADEARLNAQATLRALRIERTKKAFTLMISRIAVCPGDEFSLPMLVDGVPVSIPVRITAVTMGSPGHIEVSAVVANNKIYEAFYAENLVAGTPAVGSGSVHNTGTSLWTVADVNAATDYDADFCLIYLAATSNDAGWTGMFVGPSVAHPVSNIFRVDHAYNKNDVYVRVPNVIGKAISILGPMADFGWDDENTVDVELEFGNLTSSDDDGVLNGSNFAIIGEEYIGFVNAELIGVKTYRLSRLLRGLRGSDYYHESHAMNEFFGLINKNMKQQAISKLEIGTTHDIYAFDIGKKYDFIPDNISLTYRGYSRKPYSPVQVEGARDMSGDLTITWVRRARKGAPSWDYTDAPLDESAELYDLEILDGATVVRTVSGLTSPTFVYTSAMQTTDFGSNQPAVDVQVYQVCPIPEIGRGHVRQATI